MNQANEKVILSRQQLSPLKDLIISQMCDYLLFELGEPSNLIERSALRALQNKDYDAAKHCCLADPCNSYLAALSCIASAYRSPMVADSVIRDAARHVAETSKHRTKERISEKFQALISSQSLQK